MRLDRRLLMAIALSFGGGNAATVPAMHVSHRWQCATPFLQTFVVSPTGAAVAAIYRDGRVHCIARDGRLLWSAKFAAAPRVSLSGSGKYSLAAIVSSPGSTLVRAMEDEKVRRLVSVQGLVESVTLSPDGQFGAAATRNGWLYIIHRDGRSFTVTRHRLQGRPRVVLAPRAGLVLVGFRGSGGVVALGTTGRCLWSLPGEASRVYDLFTGPSSHALGIISYRERTGDDSRAYVIASSGSLIWKARIPGTRPIMALEADGARAAIGFTQLLRSGTRVEAVQKIAFYDSMGHLLWEKGGFFFSPRLLGAVTPGPSVVAWSPAAKFYLLGDRGRIESFLSCRTTIRRAESSWDGRSIVAWTGDSALHYLTIE